MLRTKNLDFQNVIGKRLVQLLQVLSIWPRDAHVFCSLSHADPRPPFFDWPRGAPETKHIPFEVHFLNIEGKPTSEIAGAGTAQLSPYVIVVADHLPDNHFHRAANGWG
ncbi:hypothetical protein IFM51744_03736 [Aspergillus udagawae]|uniref:Uncharacterized protein n=1 Tax=Aspergillus udagawae TaxID=91492 RepID=A0ABQ1BB49_9EURO|nr:hypothetical protein IFM51744_03736 [Aspergillus udagawae]GFF97675.1 hypothetical protein IFM53868_09296 [Aspergillus udagawae]GFG17746.1 hypothetical protein IFM5058_08639 [Aspergillus udagawae]